MTTGRHRPTAATTLRIALGFVVALVVYTGTALVWLIAGGPGPLPLWLVAVSTVVLAGLLSAGAEVIDRVVDRLTLGSADPSAVHALLRRMGQSLPVDEVLPRLAEATSRSLGQSRAEVEVLLAHGVTRAQVWPPSAPLGAPGLTVSVTHAGAPVGRMTIEIDGLETDPVQRRLLGDLIGPAGIALATVRLTDDLRERREELSRTTAQLRRANQRLLAARRGERERLRVQVDRRVQADLQRALDDLARPEGRAPHWVEHALDEMRSIARGIYPPRLDEAGLAVALLGWCARRGVAWSRSSRSVSTSKSCWSCTQPCAHACISVR